MSFDTKVHGTTVTVTTIRVEVVLLERVAQLTPVIIGDEEDVLWASTETIDHDVFIADMDAAIGAAIRRAKAWLDEVGAA